MKKRQTNKRRQRKHRAATLGEIEAATAGGFKLAPRLRPLKIPPTDLELTAKNIVELNGEITMIRRRIGHIENDLAAEQKHLGVLMLSHASAVLKQQQLSQVPQP